MLFKVVAVAGLVMLPVLFLMSLFLEHDFGCQQYMRLTRYR